jgi:hypothetical protein
MAGKSSKEEMLWVSSKLWLRSAQLFYFIISMIGALPLIFLTNILVGVSVTLVAVCLS